MVSAFTADASELTDEGVASTLLDAFAFFRPELAPVPLAALRLVVCHKRRSVQRPFKRACFELSGNALSAHDYPHTVAEDDVSACIGLPIEFVGAGCLVSAAACRSDSDIPAEMSVLKSTQHNRL